MDPDKGMTSHNFPKEDWEPLGALIVGTRVTMFLLCYEAKFFNFDDNTQTTKTN